MLDRLLGHVRGNVVGYLALFIALGGVSWAASAPLRDKQGSVDSVHIEDGAVKSRHLTIRGVPPNPQPPSDGNYTGEWSAGQLKLTYEDKKIGQIIYLQLPSGSDPPCGGLFVSPTIKTVGTQQYVTGTNEKGQNFQLQIQWEEQNRFEILSGSLTQSTAPTMCAVPAGTELEN